MTCVTTAQSPPPTKETPHLEPLKLFIVLCIEGEVLDGGLLARMLPVAQLHDDVGVRVAIQVGAGQILALLQSQQDGSLRGTRQSRPLHPPPLAAMLTGVPCDKTG